MPDDGLHPVIRHQLELLEPADPLLLAGRERGDTLQLLQLVIVLVMLVPEAPKFLVLGRESFDQRFPIHAGLLWTLPSFVDGPRKQTSQRTVPVSWLSSDAIPRYSPRSRLPLVSGKFVVYQP